MAFSSASGNPPSGLTDRSGSFFKLIDTFALEIGELKKEMVQTSPTMDKEAVEPQGLESEEDERVDRLIQTHPVWLLLAISEEKANHILLKQPPGVFLVRKSAALQRKYFLCVLRRTDQELLSATSPSEKANTVSPKVSKNYSTKLSAPRHTVYNNQGIICSI
ncbi:hypothetical protein INR49_031157 [Caranx melampygus]|nr:hypothetical protein INR49_031157 [Caranx melampygus]